MELAKPESCRIKAGRNTCEYPFWKGILQGANKLGTVLGYGPGLMA
jgi:hypothetical protein